ncbi:uncharacterized protein LTR77_000413 [Saxophila tyrrhenica]|uniref:Pathogen-related protein n=1 Tax=Saxophila tyrrhenica TaxID=1690608 RepID=A0AAV9PN95_9PEZI|nr:hypothetical protein LTR77_000413 [Saxophila tyrrhenica]
MADAVAAESTPAVPDYLASPNAVFADEGVQWRYGRAPDYSKTRKVWEEGKKSNHVAGSLPQLVENLVKNWEVEASFKPRLSDWRTIDHDNYTFAMNGGSPQSAEHMLKVGTYNAIIEPNEYYDPNNSDFASSHKTFKRMMPTFAWEVMEVYSGPPVVAFKWRHWGTMKNDYVGFNNKGEKVTAKAHGGPIEIFGITIAKVDDKVRLQAIDTWMDPLAMFRQIAPHGIVNKESMNRKAEKADALDDGPGHNGINIAEEHKSGDSTSNVDQAAGADIPKHVSNKTGEFADSPVPQMGACPFIARNGMLSSESVPADHPAVPSTNGTNTTSLTNGSNGLDATPLEDMNGLNEHDRPGSLQTPTQASFSKSEDTDQAQTAEVTTKYDDAPNGSDQEGPLQTPRRASSSEPTEWYMIPRDVDMTQPSDANGGHPEVSNAAVTAGSLDGVASMDIDATPSTTAQQDLLDANTSAATSLPIPEAGSATTLAADQQPPKRAAEDSIPRSIYSSAVTGNVEDVIKVARNGDYADESVMTGTYDAVDKHLESPADHVHRHPKTMEEVVKPDPGEAVAVSGKSEETRQTYQEMSDIKPEEKEMIMNRE